MKNKCLALVILLLMGGMIKTSAQIDSLQAEKLSDLCKIWGVGKYFSPAANNYNLNYDSLLFEYLAFSEEEYLVNIPSVNQILLPSLTRHENLNRHNHHYVDSLYNSLKFSNNIAPKDIGIIKSTLQNKHDSLFYITYNYPQGNFIPKNESTYNSTLYPSINLRILSVFRVWNWVFYFYPYKHLIHDSWNDILPSMLMSVGNARDSVEYQLAIREYFNKIEDAHSYTGTSLFYNHFATKQIPLLFSIIKESIYVRGVLSPIKMGSNKMINRGDNVLELDHRTYAEYKDAYFKYCAASNLKGKEKKTAGMIKWTKKDSVQIKYVHNSNIHESYIYAIQDDEIYQRYKSHLFYDSIYFINNEIAYVDLSRWSKDDIPKLINKIYNTKAIIIDLRQYPEWTMFDILQYFPHDTSTPTFALWEPTKQMPGHFTRVTVDNMPFLHDSLYRGQIISLVNNFTQSRSEFYTMALQICDNNITIGSKTAGADGDVSCFWLPGNIEACFSGIGIEYHNGVQTQQIGVQIDVPIEIIQSDLIQYKDPYLEKTIKYTKKLIKKRQGQ